MRDLNGLLRSEPALYERDFDPEGFYWLEANDAENNIVAFCRTNRDGSRVLVSFYDEAGVASNSTGPVAGQDYAFT